MAGEQPKKVVGGAFGQFMNEKRPELLKAHPGPATKALKAGSEMWKAMSDAEKKPYEDKYNKAKEQYAKDMDAFLLAGGEKKGTKRKSKEERKAKRAKAWKDPNAPKKPVGGAYMCYLDKHRAAITEEVKGQPITAISKLGASRWNALSDAEKKPYEDAYKAKQDAYAEAMKTYVAPTPPEGAKTKADLKAEAKQAKADEKQAKADEKAAAKAAKAEAKAEKKSGLRKSAGAKLKAKPAAAPEPDLPANILAKAEKLGYKDTLIKLASRDDVKAAGKTPAQMLKALEDNNGLLHPSRRALVE